MDRYPNIHERPSVFEHIRSHVVADQLGLAEGAAVLPDEERVRATTRSGWASGALDGVGTHHVQLDANSDVATQLAAAIAVAIEEPSAGRLESLYALLEPATALNVVDSVIEALGARAVARDDVRELGTWLATTAPDREPVKLGIALSGAAGLDQSALEIVRLLGRHEEFTLYAAVAFRNGLEAPEPELFALAHHVHGWGRIQLVERLAETSDAAIKQWILREGFRNGIMNEYLAYIAATTGGLADALRSAQPDRDLLTAAGEILVALFHGGPAGDIDDYDDGVDATERFTAHLLTRAETLDDGLAAWEIEQFVARDDDWDLRVGRGWTVDRRAMLAQRCAQVLDSPRWGLLVLSGLASPVAGVFWQADRLAPRVGVDAYPAHRAKLDLDVVDSWAWQRAFALSNIERADELLALANDRLPFDNIATGAGNESGFGPGFEAHMSIDAVLGHILTRPGKAPLVVLAALRSPVTRNRNAALRALANWPRDAWPEGSIAHVEHIAAQDPNDHTREQAQALL